MYAVKPWLQFQQYIKEGNKSKYCTIRNFQVCQVSVWLYFPFTLLCFLFPTVDLIENTPVAIPHEKRVPVLQEFLVAVWILIPGLFITTNAL